MRALMLLACVAACGDDDGPAVGPDARDTIDANQGMDMPAVPPGCATDRSLVDRPDDSGFDQIRVIYVVPSDLPDGALDTNGKICNSTRAFATWFHEQTQQYLRFDTAGGMIDIGFVRVSKTDAQMRGNDPNNTNVTTGTAFVRNRIELELEAMGLIADNKLYAIYYDGSSVYACGGGAYPPLIEDRVGAMYLGGMPPGVTTRCGDTLPWGLATLVPHYLDYGMLHELVHSLGFVPQSAPNQVAQGHVFDTTAAQPNHDLMYSPRTSSDPYWGTEDAGGLVIDINHDDYWTTSPALDLAKSSLIAPLPAGAVRPLGW